MSGQETQARQAWHEIVCDTLKHNSIQLVTYVDEGITLCIRSSSRPAYAQGFGG